MFIRVHPWFKSIVSRRRRNLRLLSFRSGLWFLLGRNLRLLNLRSRCWLLSGSRLWLLSGSRLWLLHGGGLWLLSGRRLWLLHGGGLRLLPRRSGCWLLYRRLSGSRRFLFCGRLSGGLRRSG
ncbi:MAG: hypothetical protein P8123_10090 [bacterium]